ncbi:MAG: hypothetical protein GXY76_11885 [Chloroflexi bacterium]|nr:hypothetical protein [Chloroflexota bacterium]
MTLEGEQNRPNLGAEARQLVRGLGRGTMSVAAYDTAWIARLPRWDQPDRPAYPEALDWLRANQWPDGSWGGEQEYYYDRVISTLAAVLALAQAGQPGRDRHRCERGIGYIWQRADRLNHAPYETVGFELIVPALAEEAGLAGIQLPTSGLARYQEIRARKLSRIPAQMLYSPYNPAIYSLEFMGAGLDPQSAAGALQGNGSIGNSPSATAYFLRQHGPHPQAEGYLTEVMGSDSGGAAFSYPLEIFERAWVLYNLEQAGLLPEVREEARPHLDYLRASWDEERGVSFSRWYAPCDLDDTATTFKVLCEAAKLLGAPEYRVGLRTFAPYAEADHYRTFLFETDPSVSSNIHLLDALVGCEEPEAAAMIEVIVRFLARMRTMETFWFDKWHASPYYATGHAILAAAGRRPELVSDSVRWILHTQNPDGSWGHYRRPTVEETAYCLQALVAYQRAQGGLPAQAMHKAAAYLRGHRHERRHPPLWIAKTLFAPLNIIESAIIGALAMYEAL